MAYINKSQLSTNADLALELYSTIPEYLKVLKKKNEPTIWLPRETALNFERLKLFQNDRHFLMTDYDVKEDNPFVTHSHYDIEPNLVIYNKDNGNHQAFWLLLNKVFCQEEARLSKSYQYLRAIESAYDSKYQCDKHFARYIHRNPYYKGALTDWRHTKRHSLSELAEVVNLNEAKIKSGNKQTTSNNSRNCTLFDELRFWAYRQDKTQMNLSDWLTKCLTKAVMLNTFPKPMALPELQAIAKSVANFTYNHNPETFAEYVQRTHTSEIQAKRGAIGGKKSKGGGRPSLNEPWKALGISRRTYFRRKAAGKL